MSNDEPVLEAHCSIREAVWADLRDRRLDISATDAPRVWDQLG